MCDARPSSKKPAADQSQSSAGAASPAAVPFTSRLGTGCHVPKVRDGP